MELIENPYTILVRRLNKIESLCEQILSHQKQLPKIDETKDDEILDVPQAANYLKYSVDRIYHLVNKGELPHFKPGGKLLFKKSLLQAFLEKGYRE